MGSVRTGPVRGPLPDEEQRVFPMVQLGLEELVLLVGQLDAQQRAPVCGGQVLLHPDLPASFASTLALPGTVQQLRCGLVFWRDAHLGHLEDQLGGP